MISLIEALNFRSLRYIRQPLGPFHILVGPNASGKTTFLDVVAFLRCLVSDGLEAAIYERTRNFQDLTWGRSGRGFELAIEARIPDRVREALLPSDFDTIRYELGLIIDESTREVSIVAERGSLLKVESGKWKVESGKREAEGGNRGRPRTPGEPCSQRVCCHHRRL